MRDTLWLFGAGASYGSGDQTVTPHQTPLGNQLAKLLAAKYDYWNLVTNFSELDWSDFETAFGKLVENNPSALLNGFRPVAHFFSQFEITENSNLYSRLAREVKKHNSLHQTVFATLNYDCLLEQALSQIACSPVCLNYHIQDLNTVTVLKLHGSCHFAPNPENYKIQGVMPAGWTNLDVPIVEITLSEAAIRYNDAQSLLADDPFPDISMPIMSLYLKGKKSFLGETEINKIQKDYAKMASACSRIMVVGVAPTFHDAHVWEPLRQTSAQLIYCGVNIADQFNYWRNGNSLRNQDIVLDGPWEKHFDELIEFSVAEK